MFDGAALDRDMNFMKTDVSSSTARKLEKTLDPHAGRGPVRAVFTLLINSDMFGYLNQQHSV